MIGIVRTSASFRSNLGYCLRDKLTPAGEVEYKQRAEILRFNQCYGNRQELVEQFREVMQLNRNVCKPYLHVVLGIGPEDQLTKSQWADISDGCAKALHFEDHQYVAILHKDTNHEHMHMLVNRIGFEGEVVEDHFKLREISVYCRQTEKDYQLRELAGPRRYQTEAQRQEERTDQRVLTLKAAIGTALETACTYPDFEQVMQRQGYKLYRNERGIAFQEKLITHPGSEAGYPWKKIESVLAENERQRLEQEQQQVQQQKQAQELRQEQEQQQELRQEQELHRGQRLRIHM